MAKKPVLPQATDIDIGISAADRKKIAEHLSRVLA
ncbi:MAG TPA: DNA starvation/stationary phase protection protein, partial [Alphaproteobacteria bacterium]|nr:DNA starvation/stationary phase protection protein [Alphaproteobacteria bacterium]